MNKRELAILKVLKDVESLRRDEVISRASLEVPEVDRVLWLRAIKNLIAWGYVRPLDNKRNILLGITEVGKVRVLETMKGEPPYTDYKEKDFYKGEE